MNKPLENSIRHWRRVVASPLMVDTHCKSCALCKAYFSSGMSLCNGCPVNARTGRIGCNGSPYNAFADALDDAREAKSVSARTLKRLKKLAQAELDFLISLRRDERS